MLAAAAGRSFCSHSSSPSSVRSLHRCLFSILRSSFLSSSNATRAADSYGKPRQLSTTTANGGGGGSWSFNINMVNHPVPLRRSRRGFSTTASVTDAIDESKSFVSVEIHCQKDVADVLSEALLCFGASSASIDQSSSSIIGDSDEICITSIFTNGKDVEACISYAADTIGLKKAPAYEIRAGEEHNWLKNAEESFHSIEISAGLWIVPQWTIPPEPQAINVILNPGMAFGTDHPTTKLCLLLLKGLIRGGETLLDYGTGSGILGIAALKLGGSLSVGIDIDPQAISSAQQNIVLNQISPDKMQLYLGDSRVCSLSPDETSNDENNEKMVSSGSPLSHRRGEFDIILANILLNPLIELAEDIVSYAKPGAVIGLSGILTEQLPRIEDCYSRYLESISTSEMDGWACLSGTRKKR